MPLPERTPRHVDTSRSPTIATVEQFLRGTGGESTRMSPTYSPTSSNSTSSPYFERLKHHDPEEDQGLYQKKSVLTKMKERARRLRNSFSKRKQEDGILTPSWGVSLEDDEEEEDDAEYLGAPMYESELAPEGYKENARQHPRANPVISDKHVLRSTVRSGVEQDRERPPSPVKSTTTTQPATTPPPGPNMTMNETIAEKLTPANAKGSDSDAANFISSKIQGLAVSRTTSGNMSFQTSPIAPPTSSAPLSTQTSLSSSPSLSGKNTSSPKGPSVKEYLKIKFEPGNDEKVLSEVISEAMSPRRTTTSDAGVMDKVRGAVNSLLRNEEPSQQYAIKTPTTRSSSQIPISTNAQEVGQEENHGRILQAN